MSGTPPVKGGVPEDTVNVAARVNSACDKDEVLVTDAVIAALPAGHGLSTSPRPAIAAKGKAEPVPVVAVLWRREEVAQVQTRDAATRLFMLSVERGPSGLRVSAMDGDSGKGTVNRHVDSPTQTADLDVLADELRLLCHDGGQRAYLAAVRDKGEALARAALPDGVRQRLASTSHRALRLHLDDATARVPFELAMVATSQSSSPTDLQPLGCAFAVGRIISAPDVGASLPTTPACGAEVVVIADPSGDLPAAREEGELVARLYESVGATVRRLFGPQTRADVLRAVGNAAVLHLAAHIERGQFGLVVTDGVVDGTALRSAFAVHTPGLVIANACHAAVDAPWATSTFTRGLLDAGVSHVVAPLWGVPDTDARAFALRFTEAAITGVPVGEAVRRARVALREQSVGALSFGGYVLFGDPRQPLPLTLRGVAEAGRTRSAEVSAPRASAPGSSSSSSSSPQAPLPTRSGVGPLQIAGAAAVVGLVAAVLAVGVGRDSPPAATSPPVLASSSALPAVPAVPAGPVPPAVPVDRTGPVRVSVLPFKGAVPQAPGLGDGVTEALVTELSGATGIRLIERGQIDVDIGELDFQQTTYVDAATRTAIGRIAGAEVVVLGSVSAIGGQARLTARFVDVGTGEVLATAKVDGAFDDVFGLQDRLGVQVRAQVPTVTRRVRP